jgi:Domain of unknown function (DUF5103)
MKRINICFFFGLLFLNNVLQAQVADSVYQPNIHSVRLHTYGDQQGLAMYRLGSGDRLELHFDDMDANYKNYYYTYQLCNYDWSPNTLLNSFDYMKGFSQMRITNYRYSSIALTRYTHYQAILPENNAVPEKSGNYMVKVFLNGDTSKTVFTRRLLVLEQKASVAAKIVQPFSPQYFYTSQKLIFSADIKELNAFSGGQQVKAVILQNNRWDNAQKDITPTYVRGDILEYNTENSAIFNAGREWRWLDLRSFSLQSDRVKTAEYHKKGTDIFVVPDMDRSAQRYAYYRDYNGMYSVETYETINPYWQGDYATVHFSFATADGKPFTGKNIYLFGQLTDYKLNDSTRMVYDPVKNLYECRAFLKQGYYSYGYLVTDANGIVLTNLLEGGNYETENTYTILLYYRSFNDRADRLIGTASLSSRNGRTGFSF